MIMAKFIALEDIGEFKKGQDVPEEKALIWQAMFLKSPVQEVKEAPAPKEKPLETLESPVHESKPHKKMWGAKK